jgi:hypothetical protein
MTASRIPKKFEMETNHLLRIKGPLTILDPEFAAYHLRC